MRLVGESYGNSILVMVNTLTNTSIEQVFPDGQSETVVSFPGYLDLVSADLSHDYSLLHFSERLPNGVGFVFKSSIISLQSFSKGVEFISTEPMSGFFIPYENERNHLIHIVGSRVTHLTVKCENNSLCAQRFRCGLNFHSVSYWQYNNNSQTAIFIYQSAQNYVLSEFRITQGHIQDFPTVDFPIHPNSRLPEQMIHSPDQLSHSTVFSFSRECFFISKYERKTCIVQHLDSKNDNTCQFGISVFPQKYYQEISVPSCSNISDFGWINGNGFCLVFVPNHFICLVDYRKSKVIMRLFLEQTIIASKMQFLQMIGSSNLLIDKESHMFFKPRIDYCFLMKEIFKYEPNNWQKIAHISSLSNSYEPIVCLFDFLQRNNNIGIAISAINSLFEFSMSFAKSEIPNQHSIIKERKAAKLFHSYQKRVVSEQSEDEREKMFWYFYLRHTSKKKDSSQLNCARHCIFKLSQQDSFIAKLMEALRKWNYDDSKWVYIIKEIIKHKIQQVSYPLPDIFASECSEKLLSPYEHAIIDNAFNTSVSPQEKVPVFESYEDLMCNSTEL